MRRRRFRKSRHRMELPLKTKQAIGTDRIIGDFFRFYMLMLLYESPKSGYELMVDVSRRLEKRVSPSIVYPFLRTLHSRHFVAQHSLRNGDRERSVNTLTPAGRALCRKLFSRFTDIVATAIEPSMQKCSHCGARVYKDAIFARISGRNLPFCCSYCAAAFRRGKTATGRH
jgi:DNA-binding PadR family transcriptional regulator